MSYISFIVDYLENTSSDLAKMSSIPLLLFFVLGGRIFLKRSKIAHFGELRGKKVTPSMSYYMVQEAN